jgi:FAD synthase
MPRGRKDIEPRWKKGESGNPKGRPQKPVLQLKRAGYKLAEINDTIQTLMTLTLEELRVVWDNPASTLLERTIASAIRKSIEKGNLDAMETLLNRVYGKPKEVLDVTTKGDSIAAPPFNINIIRTDKPTEE